MGNELEVPMCRYYADGVCLYMRYITNGNQPTVAMSLTIDVAPRFKTAFGLSSETEDFCRANAPARKITGAAQKDSCNSYTPN